MTKDKQLTTGEVLDKWRNKWEEIPKHLRVSYPYNWYIINAMKEYAAQFQLEHKQSNTEITNALIDKLQPDFKACRNHYDYADARELLTKYAAQFEHPQQPTLEAIEKMAEKIKIEISDNIHRFYDYGNSVGYSNSELSRIASCIEKIEQYKPTKSLLTSALGYSAGDNWIERVKVLGDALKDAVAYEEGCRKTMCEVNKEFDMDEPKELAWVIKAKQVLQS